MRKLLVSLAVTLVGSVGVPATAETSAGYSQVAFTTWIEGGSHNRGDFYGAIGVRDVSAEGDVTRGLVFKGTCRRRLQEEGGVSVICRAGGMLSKTPEEFEFSPVLESASLRMRAGGYAHRVTWTGSGSPQGTGSLANENETLYADAGLIRGASAKGRVFGERVTHGSHLALGVLAEWGSAYRDYRLRPAKGVQLEIGSNGHVTVTRLIQLD